MSDTLTHTLASGLQLLQDFTRDGARPAEAQQRLSLLQANHPEIPVDLLWEEESYDQFVHYDILFHLGQTGMVSLSFCPDRAVPWPMRGVHRWNEGDLLRVNQSIMRMDQAIGCIDLIWNEHRIMDRLIHVCILKEEFEQHPLELSDAELQDAMDAFRRARRLYRAEDTWRWMARQGMTQDTLERLVADEATVAKLRDKITAGQVETYFAQHQADFDTACIARIDFPDADCAIQALSQIQHGEADFYAVAQSQAVAASRSGEVSSQCFATVRREQLHAEWQTALFSALSGDVIGPVRDGDAYTLIRMLSLTPASLDELTHRAIQQILFTAWLEERRQTATIEWFWGNAHQSSHPGTPDDTSISPSLYRDIADARREHGA
jgi:putative peptide maturation system protein